jgi:RHS repeat-associated protein
MSKMTRPENSKGQRLSYDFEYDGEIHMYPSKIANSYGYSSEAEYDVRYGQLLSSKDANSNEISYTLDNVGRVKTITGPYEKTGANKTIEFTYHPNDAIPWALTKHYDPSNPKNTLNTVVLVDGLGRILQTKKDIALFDGEGKPDVEKMSASGKVVFDAFGRPVAAYYPTVGMADDASLSAYVDVEDSIDPTTTTYDILNRELVLTSPDGAVFTNEYGFENDRSGKKQFISKTTDANGNLTEEFTDVRGNITAIKKYNAGEAIWTSFKHNVMSELLEVTDNLGNTTFSAYDKFGRRTERKHPDTGVTSYRYDLVGNLIEVVTANLFSEGLSINYDYNFERLEQITYPKNPENSVKYTYGEAGATFNRAGRIVLQEDATGAQEFFYGQLGEVVKNIRTIVIPQHDEQTYVTEWEYDTWNRLTSMTYADGEKVVYNYNVGGLLLNMSGKKKNSTYNYVDQIGYDKFEQRVFMAYGNGTKTTYAYEPKRRRLQNVTSQTSAKRVFLNNNYTYDNLNNILSVTNTAGVPSANLMGGSAEYFYHYDDLYRLISAEGNYKGSNDEHSYVLAMTYNTVGSILKKTQQHLRKGNEQKKTSYNLGYTYSESQPHAPVHIGDQSFTYDANGNQSGWTSDVSGQKRRVMWDEENRIRAIYDNGALYHYTYDASGERVLKGQSTGQRIFVNGEWKAGSGQMGNYTVYVNPYLVLKSGGYTKHYYIEGQRVVSKLGGGWDNNGQGPLKAGNGKIDFAGKGQRLFDGIVKNLKFLGADGQILTAGKSGKVPPGQINGSGGANATEAFRYFYHPDHLGSTSFITDASGEVFQHLEYFAFGETLVEEHSNTNRTPYLFNGKELDEETGLYYYGARYYDPKTSVFQSVDPSAEKYPFLTPYAYVANNPVNVIDPDGKDIVYVNSEGAEVHREANDKVFKTYIQATTNASKDPSKSTKGWKEVPMPKVIQERTQTKEATTDPGYQKNDYLIAARTGYFNQAKNAGLLHLYTEGGIAIPQETIKSIPDLDPTLVKAMTIQESHAGITGITDVMQTNVGGDWDKGKLKPKYGLQKGVDPTVTNSLYAGIRILATKGFKGGVTYDKKTGAQTFTFQGWFKAAAAYNSTKGTEGYKGFVETMINNSVTPTPSHYIKK